MNINRLLEVPYVECGRSLSGLDCWGLVVHVKREKFGQELPDFGASKRGREMHESFSREEGAHKICEFSDGAIACVFKSKLGVEFLSHVGVVVDGKVLHTSEKKGARLDAKAVFEKLGRVSYYD